VETRELQVKNKKEADAKKELTHAGPVFVPPVDIFENKDALVVIADMPGVTGEEVDIHVKENELTISGRRKTREDSVATPIYTEYESGGYLRSFTLSNAIDQTKIEASMKDGVLKVILPKAEATKPRIISVKAG